MRRALGVSYLVCLAACPPETKPPVEKPVLVVTLDAPDLIEVSDAAPRDVTVTVKNADGTPAKDYSLRANCECAAVVTPLANTGTETVRLTAEADGSFETFALSARPGGTGATFSSRSHWLLSLLTTPTKMYGLVKAATMAVGEKRPFAAIASAGRDRSVDAPTTWDVSSGIATVDADGVVTAVTAGTAVLTAHNGPLSVTVALTVDASRVPGIAAAGRFAVGTLLPDDSPSVGQAATMKDHTMVLDSRGYPHLIVRSLDRAVLMSWSGTGFGLELLPDAFPESQAAYLAIDSRDRLYVVGASFVGAFVYEKQATAPPSAWRKRVLGQRLASLDDAGVDSTREIQTIETVSMLPRIGGGIELAYAWVIGPVAGDLPCTGVYRYANVGDDAIELSDITFDQASTGVNGQCPDLKQIAAQTLVLVRDASGRPVFLLPYGNRIGRNAIYKSTGQYTRVGAQQWDLAEPAERANADVPPISINAWSLGGDAGIVVYEDLAPLTSTAPIAFHSRQRLWVGGTAIESFFRYLDPAGTRGDDSPFAVWAASEFPRDEGMLNTMWGAVADDDRLHIIAMAPGANADALAYFTRALPFPDATTTTPEAKGRALEGVADLVPARITSAPIVFADGSRAVLAKGGPLAFSELASRVLRSPRVDAPWDAGEAISFSTDTPMVERNGTLYAMGYTEFLHASVDRGTSWQLISGRAGMMSGETKNLRNLSGGLVADLTTQLALFPDPGVTDAGFVLWDLPAAFDGFQLQPEPMTRNVFSADGGVYFVAGQASSSTRLYWAQLGWDAGLVSQRNASKPIPFVSYQPRLGAQVSPTEIVFPSYPPSSGLVSIITSRLDLETGNWQLGDAGQFLFDQTPIIRRSDGGLVLGGTMSSRQLHGDAGMFHQQRAVLLYSGDGLTWSAPRVIREHGGDSQRIDFMTDDGDGGVLVVLTDNLGMGIRQAQQVVQRVAP